MLKMICMGDSLTYGFGAYAQDAWPYIVSEKLHIQCINQGINGDYTSGMCVRFKKDVLGQKPDFVFVLGGSNDILNGWPLERTIAMIKEMVVMARTADILPVIGIPMCIDMEELIDEGFPESMALKFVKKFGEYREMLIKLCTRENIKYVDFYDLYPKYMAMEGHRYWYIDGVHPTKEGYRIMAEIVCDYMEKFLK